MATQLKPVEKLNASGFVPIDKRVLVLPDVAPEKVGSLIMPQSKIERDQYAQCDATLVAVGETAWAEASNEAERFGLSFTAPAPGDRVLIAKYGGTMLEGRDGKQYRIMNDEDVIARLQED